MEGLFRLETPLRSGPFQFHPFPSGQMPDHRFPAPWSVEEHSSHFIVRDHNGQGLAYIYYESELRPALSRKPLTKDEARRVAANIAKLPDLLRKT
jgi:hypothetical protein